MNWLEIEEKVKKNRRKERRKKKESWLGVLEKLNKNEKYVWSPVVLGGKIVGVRKIRPL
jgi:hypothetical protein